MRIGANILWRGASSEKSINGGFPDIKKITGHKTHCIIDGDDERDYIWLLQRAIKQGTKIKVKWTDNIITEFSEEKIIDGAAVAIVKTKTGEKMCINPRTYEAVKYGDAPISYFLDISAGRTIVRIGEPNEVKRDTIIDSRTLEVVSVDGISEKAVLLPEKSSWKKALIEKLKKLFHFPVH